MCRCMLTSFGLRALLPLVSRLLQRTCHPAHPAAQATLGRLGLSAPDLAGLASGQLVSGESLAGDCWESWRG